MLLGLLPNDMEWTICGDTDVGTKFPTKKLKYLYNFMSTVTKTKRT